MAYINSKGLVDDGSKNLYVAGVTEMGGSLTVHGVISSSVGAFGEFNVFNNGTGQTLSPNTWLLVNQWLTSTLQSPAVTAANNGLTASLPGLYVHYCTLSFSGTAGTYTFAIFDDGTQEMGSTIQTTINVGQSYPRNITIIDIAYHSEVNLPTVYDIRVQSNNGGPFVINYGNFGMFRVIG